MKMQLIILVLALGWINEAHSASRVFLKDWQENEFNRCFNDTVEKTLLASDKKIVAFLRYNYGQRSAPFLSLDAEFLIENRDGSDMKAVAIELVSASNMGWVPTTEDGFYLSYYSDGMVPKAKGYRSSS